MENNYLVHVVDGNSGRYQIGIAEDKQKAEVLASDMIEDLGFNIGDGFLPAKKIIKLAETDDFFTEIKKIKVINKTLISWD